jgi:membrane protein required for colicin V production
MNWLDIIIIVAIVISTFMGFRAGLIKGVVLLAGLIVGVVLAGRYYAPFSEQLTFISEANIAKVVAFAIILIVVMVIAAVLARFLKWAVSVIMLGWVNRLGGAIFGFILGAIFCSALLAICVKFLDVAGVITESGLANILLDQLPMVLALLPDEFDSIPSFFY